MNGTPTSGFFNFSDQAKPDGLELAQESLHLYERAGIAAEDARNSNDIQLETLATDDLEFYATQTLLRLGLSIAVDLRRIANALEGRHV